MKSQRADSGFTLRQTQGFTLIELLLVIVLISILATASSVFYARFLLQNGVDNTANQLTGSLRKAQTYAMAGKQASSWGVNYSANTITLFKGTSFGADHSFDETYSVNPNVTISGWSDTYFSKPSGLPTPSTLSLTISGGGNSKTVTMNSQGVASRN